MQLDRVQARKKRKQRRRISIIAMLLLIAAAVLACTFLAVRVYRKGGFPFLTGPDGDSTAFFTNRKTVRLWYTDSALDDYLNEAALVFNEMNNGIRLDVMRKDEVEFLEQISRASIQGEEFPDLYITGNDRLEMAYLSGLAMPVENDLRFDGEAYYSRAALDAVTVSNVIAAYPMYFETAAFVYVPELTEGYEIPRSIVDLIRLSNSYNAPANVRDVFTWDVNDIFYNYGFVGDAMNIGGESGDDPETLKIYDEDVLRCLLTYQQLSSYFSIDPAEMDY
ncbi:MAG: hypothetical protein J6P87_07095, partial [Lachnospiraceae bacterium]|nr:hypothetical protein [Lachnospiraceae bacterium]